MDFSVVQTYDASAETMFDLFLRPETKTSLPEFGRISRPEPLDAIDRGDRRIVTMRYRFTADLPAAATVVVNPDKLTWIEETTYDRPTLTGAVRFLPDHYASKMEAAAETRFENAETGSIRSIDGRFSVKLLFGSGPVEKAIVSGLREHLELEQQYVAKLLDED